eukprot:Nk52_evm1s2119 gene=Nk52_evmTU1s2119
MSSQPPQVMAAGHSTNQMDSQQQIQSREFWAQQTNEINIAEDFKTGELPLARIKKIMKTDEEVKMISAEAPVLFAKACELFILEITMKAWYHTEDNKRRTLQRNDVAMAISKCDTFDFLIDIVPRDELKTAASSKKPDEQIRPNVVNPEQLQYYYQMAQVNDPALLSQMALYQQQLAHQQQQQQQQQGGGGGGGAPQLMGGGAQFDPQQHFQHFQHFQGGQFMPHNQ